MHNASRRPEPQRMTARAESDRYRSLASVPTNHAGTPTNA